MSYKKGIRELDVIGEMEIQKYNPENGLFEKVYIIAGYTRTRDWFSNIELFFTSEEEWVKAAISEARHLKADRVVYKAGMGRCYHSQVIWDYATEQNYHR